ncbi:MAG: 4Fe-4S binding protein [Coriobacteriia bacterium]|nr:4Fe-4S binding protein [Coriobacteriia bacterium]
MADFLDDLIGMSKEFDKLKNELSDMGSSILGEEPERLVWNPSDYKEYPKVNPERCVRSIFEGASCTRCLDICPTDSISFEDGYPEILKDCRRCGLCVQTCPNNALYITKYSPDALYRKVSQVAGVQHTAYVTCTRALGHVPEAAQIVLPCVGLISAEVWSAIKLDYPNIAIYLPIGICDKCKTITGEEAYVNEVSLAEVWTDSTMDLVVSEDEMVLETRRDVERKNFIGNAAKSVGLSAAKVNPLTARLARTYEKLEAHQLKFNEINKTIDRLVGVKTNEKKRYLTPERQLVLTTIKSHYELAERMHVLIPDIKDASLYDEEEILEVVDACPTGALDYEDEKISIEALYCTGCDLCADMMPGLFTMQEMNAEKAFYRLTPEAKKEREEELERKRQREEERASHIQQVKDFAKRAGDISEKIADDIESKKH